MIDRTHLRNFLNSIPGLEGWSDSVEQLNGVEMLLNVLAEPTQPMIEAGGDSKDAIVIDEFDGVSIYPAAMYRAMWSARFRGE